MNHSFQFCPRCRKDVAVHDGDGRQTCPQCGGPVLAANPASSRIPPLIPPTLPLARPIGRSSPPWYVIALIILVAVLGFAIVGVALCYAGCVLIMNKINH
jgi:hypothetical protein